VGKGETISVTGCCSTEGHFIPPACVIKGVNKKEEFKDGLPPGLVIITSKKSAYVTSKFFVTLLKDHMLPRKPRGKVLIVRDGHSSHVSGIGTVKLAIGNDELLCLPNDSTHYLQPLDSSFFKWLKYFFRDACET
jgi:hypothetical protein